MVTRSKTIKGPQSAALVVAALACGAVTGCGGRAGTPSPVVATVLPGGGASSTGTPAPAASPSAPPSAPGTTGAADLPSAGAGGRVPGAPQAGPDGRFVGLPGPSASSTGAAAQSSEQAALAAYERYLYVLSGLQAYLNRTWIPPLAEVTTADLAAATVRSAAAIARARSHAVGTLRHSRVRAVRSGPDRVSVVDCQNQRDYYLVSDATGRPDPAIARGFFVGSATVVRADGVWRVSTYTTTQRTCRP